MSKKSYIYRYNTLEGHWLLLDLSDDTVDKRSFAMPWEANHVLIEPGENVCVHQWLPVSASWFAETEGFLHPPTLRMQQVI